MGELTSEEMERLRVRLADLPGFDPVPLFAYLLGDDEEEAWVVVGDGSTRGVKYAILWSGSTRDVPLSDVWVSTADARTRDALARWVAGRVGMSPASTAPAWHVGDPAPGTWNLRWWYTEFVTFHAPRPSSYRGTKVSSEHEVSALGGLDSADPRRLPDGSRWVDAAALAAVCGWCVGRERAP